MLGMSRARLYQLMSEGVFPKPKHDPSRNRPYFDEEMQQSCLEVRRRNCGINGQPILFYPPRTGSPAPARRAIAPKPKAADQHAELIELLGSLGMSATAQQVEAAIQTCFPSGAANNAQGEVVRSLFLYLKRQESK